jgi:hypothetical protein
MPLPLLPLLFTAGSIAANAIGADKQGKALASNMAAERLRQKKFDDESFALNEAGRARVEAAPEQIETRGDDLAAMFSGTGQEAPAEPIITTPASSSNVVMSREGAAMDKSKAFTDARADNLGALRSFGDVFGDVSRLQGRDAGQLGLIGSMRRGSQGVLPMELEAAQGKGAEWRLLGDILSAGSMFAGPGGPLAAGGFKGINIGGPGSLWGKGIV